MATLKYRQGDILIEQIDQIPQSAKRERPKTKRIILAKGEVTGHHHSVDIDFADWWKNDAGEQFITAKKEISVVHQEHAPVILEPGNYRVKRQREYTPESIRNVAD